MHYTIRTMRFESRCNRKPVQVAVTALLIERSQRTLTHRAVTKASTEQNQQPEQSPVVAHTLILNLQVPQQYTCWHRSHRLRPPPMRARKARAWETRCASVVFFSVQQKKQLKFTVNQRAKFTKKTLTSIHDG